MRAHNCCVKSRPHILCTPLIAISGEFRSGLCATGTTAQMPGVEQVLAKPLTRGELLDAVRAIIGAPS
jgi:hypothetical protein